MDSFPTRLPRGRPALDRSLRRFRWGLKPRCWSSPSGTLLLALAAVALTFGLAESVTAQALDGQEASESDTLTVEDVRRFLDPRC